MTDWPKQVEYDDLAIDLTLIDITGIEDPLRDGVQEAVADCKMAGVHATHCPVDHSTMWHLHYLQCYHGRTTFPLAVAGCHEGVLSLKTLFFDPSLNNFLWGQGYCAAIVGPRTVLA